MHSIEEMTRAGCTTARGIRFWEDQGLLGNVQRSSGNLRLYTDAQMDTARVIAAAQFGGWTLDEIKQMVAEYDAEVYEAILIRLADQARAAARLGETLPKPKTQAQEYDL